MNNQTKNLSEKDLEQNLPHIISKLLQFIYEIRC